MKNNKELISILEEIGLTNKESEIYFSLLFLGSSTPLELSRHTQLKRTTIYSTLEKLKNKGLVNIEINGLKQKYIAENPQRLKNILDEKINKFKNVINEYSEIYSHNSKRDSLKHYYGLESVKNIYKEILSDVRNEDDYLVIGQQNHWLKLDKEFFEKFIEKRAKLKINIKLIFTDSNESRKYKKFQKNFNQEVRILDSSISLKTNMVITPQKIIIHKLSTPVSAIVIKSNDIIDMHQKIFWIIWNSLK